MQKNNSMNQAWAMAAVKKAESRLARAAVKL
jgi:hypothetical protein